MYEEELQVETIFYTGIRTVFRREEPSFKKEKY